jgi:hypothetical protein
MKTEWQDKAWNIHHFAERFSRDYWEFRRFTRVYQRFSSCELKWKPTRRRAYGTLAAGLGDRYYSADCGGTALLLATIMTNWTHVQ